MSEGHLRQMLVVGENAGKHIQDYSATFQSEFVAMLSRRLVLFSLLLLFRSQKLNLHFYFYIYLI